MTFTSLTPNVQRLREAGDAAFSSSAGGSTEAYSWTWSWRRGLGFNFGVADRGVRRARRTVGRLRRRLPLAPLFAGDVCVLEETPERVGGQRVHAPHSSAEAGVRGSAILKRIGHPNSQFCQFSSFDEHEACLRTLPRSQIPPQEVLPHPKVKNPRLICALGGSIALQQTQGCIGRPQAVAKSSSSCRNGGGCRARGTVPRTT
jgi:hypothetical protein